MSSLAKAPAENKTKPVAKRCNHVTTITAKRADKMIDIKAPVSVLNHRVIKVLVSLSGNDKRKANSKTAATEKSQAIGKGTSKADNFQPKVK